MEDLYSVDQTDLDNFFVNKDEHVEEDSYDNDFVILQCRNNSRS